MIRVAGVLADFIGGAVVFVAAAPTILTVWLTVRWSRAWTGVWRAAALVPVAVLTAWIVTLFLSWPHEHTLWPFELAALGVPVLLYLLAVRGIWALAHRGEK